MALNFKSLFLEETDKVQQEIMEQLDLALEEMYGCEIAPSLNIKPEDYIAVLYGNVYLSDLSNSVYQVDKLCGALDKDMTQTSKKKSLLSLMRLTGLSNEHVAQDCDKRRAALNKSLSGTVGMVEEKTAKLEEEISKHRKAIADKTKEIVKLTSYRDNVEKTVRDELRFFDRIMEYIGNTEADKTTKD